MIRDARGKPFEFEYPPKRVVSLVPSLTETLFDLGAGDEVVGVTEFCVFPENLDRPRLGGTKNPRVGEIHDRKQRANEIVREIETELASMPRRQFTFACAIWKRPWMWCGGDTYVS